MELPGGGPDRTMADVRALMSTESVMSTSAVVRALFRLRLALGRLFGWDRPAPPSDAHSYQARLTERDREASLVPPGTADGSFSILYALPRESVSEIRNATVHAFSVFALEPGPDGYRLYWAIHVAPVGRVTALYMALIDPFRRLLVYPAILQRAHDAWQRAHPCAPDASPLSERDPVDRIRR